MEKARKLTGNIIFWVIWPGLYIMLSRSHRVRVIINVGEKVLFVNNWLGDNKLSLPGGGIQPKESPKQTAIREVYEETGITLEPKDLKSVTVNMPIRQNGIKYLVDCYCVSLPKTLETHSQHIEIFQSVWLLWRNEVTTNHISKATKQLLETWLSTQHLVD